MADRSTTSPVCTKHAKAISDVQTVSHTVTNVTDTATDAASGEYRCFSVELQASRVHRCFIKLTVFFAPGCSSASTSTALNARQLHLKRISLLSFCLAADDCFPGLFCTYTAKAAYARCAKPAATGQACGARFDGQTDGIGDASSIIQSLVCICLLLHTGCVGLWKFDLSNSS